MNINFRLLINPALAILLLGLPAANGEDEKQTTPKAKFPSKIISTQGNKIDVAQLAGKKKVAVVTLKATWCKVCQNQLKRIKKKLPEINNCGVTFLVLAPGPVSELRAIQTDIGFDYPFIEDSDLAISKSLKLNMNDKEIYPSIFILNTDLTIGWIQKGRNSQWYGDPALMDEINCGDWI